MTSRCLRDEVMGLTARLADECHPQVVLQHAEELARYARLTSACDALESFLGMRPGRMTMFLLCSANGAQRLLT